MKKKIIRYRRIGEQGEKIVIKAEKIYLKSIGKESYTKDIIHVSKEDDSLGYDILSFNETGEKRYIEVKSTTAKPSSDVSFNISQNQCQKARELNNYYLYIVFEVKSKYPTIWKIKDLLSYENKGLILTPLNFRATISTI